MPFDLRTLAFLSVLSSLMCAVTTLVVASGSGRESALRAWGLATTGMGLGSVLVAMRGVAPGWASLSLGNALLMASLGWLVVGFRRFAGGQDSGRWAWAVGVVTAVLISQFDTVEHMAARMVWTSLVTMAAAAGSLFFLARFWRLHRVTAGVTAALFLLGIGVHLWRVVVASRDGVVGDLMTQRALAHLGPFIHSILFQTWLPVAIGQFVNARLRLTLIGAREEAEAGSRAKSTFLATMSHELRTPMNGVLNLTDLALDEPLTDTARQYLRGVHESAKSLLGILNDILDFSRLEAARVELEHLPFSLGDLMRQLEALLGPGARSHGLAFCVAGEGELPKLVLGDPLRLQQVLHNLLGNAVKFTRTGSVKLTVTAPPGEGRLRFAVVDTGVGLSAEARTRLFESFAQADASTTRKFGGTGLGLAISQRLVKLMGGEIEVASKEGVGSCFSFSLPCELPAAGAAATLEVKAARPSFVGVRVLLVEDNATNQLVGRRLLERQGVEVTVAGTGREALARVKDSPVFDVVLMDLQMPELDGLEATRQLRALGFDRPIVAMTADVLTAREHCLAAGMNDHLTKPIDPTQLYAMITSSLSPRGRGSG